MKVINYRTEALDNKQGRLSLLIDFSKAFDTIEHLTLIGCLFMNRQLGGFENYLSDRTQAVHLESAVSEVL